MVVLLVRTLTFVCSAAIGLLVTSLVVTGFSVHPLGFVTTVLVFTVLQSVFAPLVGLVAKRYASALLGGVGIVATFLALLVAEHVGGALRIDTVSAWLAATFLVWLCTAVATLLLPLVLFRKTLRERAARRG